MVIALVPENGGPGEIRCPECDNDTFIMVPMDLPSGAVTIERAVCAICGETTDFSMIEYLDKVNGEQSNAT